MKKSILFLLLFVSFTINAQIKKITDLPPGTYTVTVTDAHNALVTESKSYQLSCDSIHVQKNICTAINVTGGTPPYTYVWNTNPIQTKNPVRINQPGLYFVIISDAKKSAIFKTFTVK